MLTGKRIKCTPCCAQCHMSAVGRVQTQAGCPPGDWGAGAVSRAARWKTGAQGRPGLRLGRKAGMCMDKRKGAFGDIHSSYKNRVDGTLVQTP